VVNWSTEFCHVLDERTLRDTILELVKIGQRALLVLAADRVAFLPSPSLQRRM
jgi:hypothetical protein